MMASLPPSDVVASGPKDGGALMPGSSGTWEALADLAVLPEAEEIEAGPLWARLFERREDMSQVGLEYFPQVGVKKEKKIRVGSVVTLVTINCEDIIKDVVR
jgi:hypothetical protein